MSTAELIEALERTCILLERSEESVWSPLTPAEAAKSLRKVIDALGQGDALDRLALGTEFAPTITIHVDERDEPPISERADRAA